MSDTIEATPEAPQITGELPAASGNTPATTPPPEQDGSGDLSFVDAFQDFIKNAEAPRAPEPDPEPEPKPEPKAKKEPKPPADPIKELDEARDDIDPDMRLPIDDTDDTVADPEPDAEDKDNPFEKGTPQHRRFREMRKEAASLKGDLDTERQTRVQLEARVKEIEAAAARAEELEKRISAYEAKIAVTNLTESEAYQNTIAAPLRDIIDRSDAIAERYGIDPDALADALELADANERRKQLKELTSGLDVDPDDHFEMRQLAAELQPLKARRAELLANADKALAELEAEKEQQRSAAALKAAEDRKAAVDKVAEKVAGQVPFLKTLDGVNYDEIVEATKGTDFDLLNPPLKAYNHMAGLLLPKLLKSHTALTRQIEQLSDDLATYRNQGPRMTPDSSGTPDTADEDEGFLDRARKFYGIR